MSSCKSWLWKVGISVLAVAGLTFAQTALAVDPGANAAAAAPLVLGTPQTCTLATPENQYWFSVNLTTGKYYQFQTYNVGVDTVLYLVGTNGTTQLAVNDDWYGAKPEVIESRIEYNMNTSALPSGAYYLYVRSYHTNIGTGAYTILAKESDFSPDAYEPDWNRNTISNQATLGAAQSHTIHINTDVDCVTIAATSNHVYQIVVTNMSSTYPNANFPMDISAQSSNLWGWSTLVNRSSGTNMSVTVRALTDQTLLAQMDRSWSWLAMTDQAQYTFIVNDLGGTYGPGTGGGDAYEVDDVLGTNGALVNQLTAETPQSHTIYPDNDEDWMKFNVEPNRFYRVSLNGNANLNATLYFTTNTTWAGNASYVVEAGGGVDYMWTNSGVCYVNVGLPWMTWTSNTSYNITLHDFGGVTAADIYEVDNTYSNASTLAVGNSQSHTLHSDSDEDYVKFTAEVGSYYYIRSTNTVGRAEPRVNLYGTNGTTVLATSVSDNNGHSLYYRFGQAGTYYLRVKDTWAPGRLGAYILSVNNMGAATDIYELDDTFNKAWTIVPAIAQYHVLGGADTQDWMKFSALSNHYYTVSVTNRTGELLEDGSLVAYIYGTNGTTEEVVDWDPTEDSPLSYMPTVSGVYYIRTTSGNDGGYQILLQDKGNVIDAYENDNYYTLANTLTAGTAQNHTLPTTEEDDIDWVKFDVLVGQNYRLDAIWPDGAYYGSVAVTLYDSRGITALHKASEDGYSGRTSLEFTPSASGTMYAKVYGHLGWLPYTLSLTDLGAIGGNGSHMGEYEATAGPAVGPDGTVYVPWRYYQYDGIQAAYLGCHRPDGTTDLLRFPSEINNSVVAGLDGALYVYCSDGNLFKMTGDRAGTVDQIWTLPGCSGPALGLDNTQYLPCSTNRYLTNVVNGVTNIVTESYGKLFAIGADGTFTRTWDTDRPILAAPVVATNGQVYVTICRAITVTNMTTNIYTDVVTTTTHLEYPGALLAFNVSSASVLWTQSVAYGRSVVVADDSKVYVTSSNTVFSYSSAGVAGTMYTLNNGSTLGTYPALGNDRLYIGFYNATNGTPTNGLAVFKLDGTLDRLISTEDPYDNAGVSSSPALCADGTIYAAAGKRLYAFDASGATLWMSYESGSLGAPVLAPNGTIYIWSSSYIYAIAGGVVPANIGWPMINHDPRGTRCNGSTVIPAAQDSAVNASEALVKDYEGDGKADLVSYDSATYTWTFRKSSTDFSITTLVFGWPGYVPLAGDMFGNGQAIPTLYSESTGNWLFNVGGTVIPLQLFGVPSPGYKGLLEDVDGDRKADPVLYNESTGIWYIMMSGSGYYVLGPLDLFGGIKGCRGLLADVDGDRKADPVIYSDSLGYWLMRLSSWGYSPVIALNNVFDGMTDGRVSMPDMDGDGKADLVLYRESAGLWYVRMSSMSYQVLIRSGVFGGTGYKSFTADVDGDGKGDLGLLQTATGQWQVRGSASFYSLRTW